MKEDDRDRFGESPAVDPVQPLAGCTALLDWLYAQANAGRWGISRERFVAALERGARRRIATGEVTRRELEEYLCALHLEDLALASGCADGSEAAWEHFVAAYRGYLRTAAATILRCGSGSADACELADSLFAELYGLADGRRGDRSLFRYFHGRSSLKTWLRAVLAQRHVDSIRARRRLEEMGDEEQFEKGRKPTGPCTQPADPHRQRYVALFTRALGTALEALRPRERDRLRLYYAEERTLAETGRLLGEHESSVSRHLDRTRRDLRQQVENLLRAELPRANGSAGEPGLSAAEIVLCFQYAAEETPIDLEKLFPQPRPQKPTVRKQEP
jgi:RNA polymerase sigma factor (sigma-70 family)